MLNVSNLLSFMQASEACYVAVPPTEVPRGFQMTKLHAATRRELPQIRPAREWTEEEAYYRTGVHSSGIPYVANDHGGALLQLPLFQADIAAAGGRSKRRGDCTKHQHAHGALSPGLMVRTSA
jgi:hypothetical protein